MKLKEQFIKKELRNVTPCYSGYMHKVFLIAVSVVLILVVSVFVGDLLFKKLYTSPKHFQFGVSFSPKYATYLKLDWRQIYIRILDELKVKHIRLPTYWDLIEKEDKKYDFSDIDFMLHEAQKADVKVILTLGARQYRWPECYFPPFVKQMSLSDRRSKTLDFIQAVVERYKSNEAIIAWEVENEPLFSGFGQGCDKGDVNFLKKEMELVRNLDKRPIILTDSGELGWWITSMRLSDIFGTTVYRTVYNKFFGFLKYPMLPYFYNLKSALVRHIFAKNNQKIIIIELQTEPWSPTNSPVDTNPKEQLVLFPLDKFKNNVNFAKGTGFSEIYLWGVEWWYFMAQKGYPQYLDYAKLVFAN